MAIALRKYCLYKKEMPQQGNEGAHTRAEISQIESQKKQKNRESSESAVIKLIFCKIQKQPFTNDMSIPNGAPLSI